MDSLELRAVTDLSSLPVLHSSSVPARKSGHTVSCDHSLNEN